MILCPNRNERSFHPAYGCEVCLDTRYVWRSENGVEAPATPQQARDWNRDFDAAPATRAGSYRRRVRAAA